jgi:hypothetical protein
LRSRALVVAMVLAAAGTAHAQEASPEPQPEPTASPSPSPEPLPSPSPSPSPSPAAAKAPEPCTCRNFVGVEVGAASIGDSRNVYGGGLGRALILGIRGVEVRLYEAYDLDDRSGTFASDRGSARFSITSVGVRLPVRIGPLSVRTLLGGAWVRRPSLRYDEAAILGDSDYSAMAQHGFGVVAGAGLGLDLGPRLMLVADLRAYLVAWGGMGGSRVVMTDGMTQVEAVTEKAGGIPATATAMLAVRF